MFAFVAFWTNFNVHQKRKYKSTNLTNFSEMIMNVVAFTRNAIIHQIKNAIKTILFSGVKHGQFQHKNIIGCNLSKILKIKSHFLVKMSG